MHRAEGDRRAVVRAPCSPEERAFFAEMRIAMGGGSISDLLRYAVARLAIEEGMSALLPETWRANYPEGGVESNLVRPAEVAPQPGCATPPGVSKPLHIGPQLADLGHGPAT